MAAVLAPWCLGITTAACSGAGEDGATGETEPTASATGQQVYDDFCAACHGRDFQGSATGPSHLDPGFAPDITTDEMYRRAITEGAPQRRYDLGRMPAIASLDEQQVTDVIAHIRSVQQERGFNETPGG